jgi:IS4 transposase
LHTQLDLRGSLPAAVLITPARRQEILWLDALDYEAGAFYLMDRGFVDYGRLHTIERARAWFVIRAKSTLRYCRLHSHPVDWELGLRSDQTITLAGRYAAQSYPDKLRRVRCYDPVRAQSLVFLTNHFGLPALLVAQLYQQRWQVELFFKWLKQHLRIKAFYGRSENAVRTQLWIALCVYALVAIARKQVKNETSLFEILQVLSVSVFDKTPIKELFAAASPHSHNPSLSNQLSLFN